MDRTRMRLVVALIVGALSVPAVAYIAGARNGATEDPAVSLPAAKAPAAVPATDSTVSDLYLACGAEGEALVAGEADGTLTPVERAALNALRTICADAGLPLPEPTSSEPPTVVIEAFADSPATAAAVDTVRDDDEYEGGHEYEDEHEDGSDRFHGEDD